MSIDDPSGGVYSLDGEIVVDDNDSDIWEDDDFEDEEDYERDYQNGEDDTDEEDD